MRHRFGVVLLCLLGCAPIVVVGRELGSEPFEAGPPSEAGPFDTAPASDAGVLADAAAISEPGPSLPWSAGHEMGDLSEWLADGTGWQYDGPGATLAVSTDEVHTGHYAIKATLESTTSGQVTQALVARDITLAQGWYGAWYFLPAPETVQTWVIMKLSNRSPSQANPDDASATLLQDPSFNLFDVDLDSSSGVFHLYLFEHATGGYVAGPSSAAVPLAQWFHVDVFFRSTPASDGRIVVQLNGVTALDTGPRATAPSADVSWLVGSAARIISPLPAVIFIDDAEIRVGAPP